MMKKTGFTLAEVLITLAIIGVVATLTLPALMTNTQEQQAKTALKKGINTLTEAAQMNQAISGWDYASITVSNTDDSEAEDQSLYNLFSERTSMDYQKSGFSKIKDASGGLNANYAVYFRDGSALLLPSSDTARLSSSNAGSSGTPGTEMQDDGLVYGIVALYDTNGTKGPNIISNCEGQALGVAAESNDADCSTKGNRVIKDQFGVRLRGGYAVPNGPAARWAFEN